VFQALKNLMVKAVTSPFSLLSSMFGGGQDFSAIQFSSGMSTLQPQEEQKLTTLAKALLDRPALKVELKGTWTGTRIPRHIATNCSTAN